MEAEQYSPDVNVRRGYDVAVDEHAKSHVHPLRRGSQDSVRAVWRPNAHFIRPFDLGTHIIRQNRSIVNSTKHSENCRSVGRCWRSIMPTSASDPPSFAGMIITLGRATWLNRSTRRIDPCGDERAHEDVGPYALFMESVPASSKAKRIAAPVATTRPMCNAKRSAWACSSHQCHRV